MIKEAQSDAEPEPDESRPRPAGSGPPTAPPAAPAPHQSHLIDGVPPLTWSGGLCCLAGAMTALMRFLGRPVGYDYLSGTSGAAFKLLWSRQWCPSNNSMGILGPEPVRRLLWSLGLHGEIVPKTSEPGNAAELQRRIVASLDHGLPLVAWGVVGPPDEDLVAGYDEGGRVLLGRSYFHTDPAGGYFRKADWYSHCCGVLVITEPGDAAGVRCAANPPPDELLRESLRYAVDLSHVAERPDADHGRRSGQAAYEAWARALLQDADFPPDDLEALTFRCLVHTNVTLGGLLDARRAAATFLQSMTSAATPAAAESLRRAVTLYELECQILAQMIELSPARHHPEERRRQLADRRLREALAALLVGAMDRDASAVEQLEQALREM